MKQTRRKKKQSGVDHEVGRKPRSGEHGRCEETAKTQKTHRRRVFQFWINTGVIAGGENNLEKRGIHLARE